MKKICQNCQYQRAAGAMDFDIPGEGQWCSNSQSPRFRSRVADTDGCKQFNPRGKKAGVGLRLKKKGLAALNQRLRKKNDKRPEG